MKKLITLLILFVGMVSSASAKTIYFANNWGKSGLRIHQWGGTGKTDWPGNAFPSPEATKVDGYDVYALDLGDCTDFMILYTNDSESDKDGNTEDVSSLGVIRKCAETSTSGLKDGDYIDFSDWNSGRPTMTSALTVYTYNLTATTADSWTNFYVYLFNGTTNISGSDWPGVKLDGTENVYSYTHKSFLSSIGLLFNQGNGQPQTCDLTATSGDNKYYIAGVPSSKIDDSWGLTVKTNASGYATWGDNWHAITIPSGIAYYAVDNGNGSATAHTVNNPAANTPMLIKGEANTTYHFAPASTGVSLSSTNAFKAGTGSTLASETDGKYNYILNGDTCKAANKQTVGTNKAYLQLSAEATARALVFDDEETTGIAVVNVSQKMNGEFFNLAGQRVAQPAKGLYIVNGKKVIMK